MKNLFMVGILLLVSFSIPVVNAQTTPAGNKKILFFSKSGGFEHSVISWKSGSPSFAEKILLELGKSNGWDFTFSKDGSKFAPDYLNQFDAICFYTQGDLAKVGKDQQPEMPATGKQALIDYVRSGKGFIGLHSATDTFNTKTPANTKEDRFLNHGKDVDPYIFFIGGEFIKHGKQQVADLKVIDPKFPGFEKAGEIFTITDEWYSLKDFTPDIHVLTVIDSPKLEGSVYNRPPFPNTWARMEGEGRVWYSALGHRDDVWTNPVFQQILVGGIKWAIGEVKADVTPNIQTAAPGAYTNPIFDPNEKAK